MSTGLHLFVFLTVQCDQWPQAPVRRALPTEMGCTLSSFLTLRLSAALSHQGGRQPTPEVGAIYSTTFRQLEEVIKTEPTAVQKETWSRTHLTLRLFVRDDTRAEKSNFPAVSQRVI